MTHRSTRRNAVVGSERAMVVFETSRGLLRTCQLRSSASKDDKVHSLVERREHGKKQTGVRGVRVEAKKYDHVVIPSNSELRCEELEVELEDRRRGEKMDDQATIVEV